MSTPTKRTCTATTKRGEPCQARAVTAAGLCAMHGGLVDPKEIGRQGGKARTRPGMSGKALPADLRGRLREAVDEDTLAKVIVSTLESGSHREKFDAAKLILTELSTGPKTQGWICTCASSPGQYCHQLEPHGFRSVPRHVGLASIVELGRCLLRREIYRGSLCALWRTARSPALVALFLWLSAYYSERQIGLPHGAMTLIG